MSYEWSIYSKTTVSTVAEGESDTLQGAKIDAEKAAEEYPQPERIVLSIYTEEGEYVCTKYRETDWFEEVLDGANGIYGYIKQTHIWQSALTADQLVQVTT